MYLSDNKEIVIEELNSKVTQALDSMGAVAVGCVQDLTPVDTGRLRNSITYSVGDNSVQVGTNVEYAVHVEYGHHGNGGKFMVRDGVSNNISQFQFIADAILRG